MIFWGTAIINVYVLELYKPSTPFLSTKYTTSRFFCVDVKLDIIFNLIFEQTISFYVVSGSLAPLKYFHSK